MQEELINFKTALIAKEKGFDWECNAFFIAEDRGHAKLGEEGFGFNHEYWGDNYLGNWNNGILPFKPFALAYSRPAQSLLQKWLREVHKINAESNYLPNIQRYGCLYIPMTGKAEKSDVQYVHKIYYDSYEEALEIALQEALKLIK